MRIFEIPEKVNKSISGKCLECFSSSHNELNSPTQVIFDILRQFTRTASSEVTYNRLFALDDGCAAKKRGSIFHIPKNLGRNRQRMREKKWRALMIQQVRNQNRPSLACLFLSPAFNRSGDNLVGLVGRIARCRGLARSSRRRE